MQMRMTDDHSYITTRKYQTLLSRYQAIPSTSMPDPRCRRRRRHYQGLLSPLIIFIVASLSSPLVIVTVCMQIRPTFSYCLLLNASHSIALTACTFVFRRKENQQPQRQWKRCGRQDHRSYRNRMFYARKISDRSIAILLALFRCYCDSAQRITREVEWNEVVG